MFKLHPWDTVFHFGKIVDKRYDGSSWEYKIKYTKYEVVQISYYVKEMFATKTKQKHSTAPLYMKQEKRNETV